MREIEIFPVIPFMGVKIKAVACVKSEAPLPRRDDDGDCNAWRDAPASLLDTEFGSVFIADCCDSLEARVRLSQTYSILYSS